MRNLQKKKELNKKKGKVWRDECVLRFYFRILLIILGLILFSSHFPTINYFIHLISQPLGKSSLLFLIINSKVLLNAELVYICDIYITICE